MPAQNLRYPFKNIDQSDDYLKIEVLEYIPPGLNTTLTTFAQGSSDNAGYGNSQIKGSVILPIPEDISDSNLVAWGEGRMGPLETVGMGLALRGITADNPFGGLYNAAADAIKLSADAAKVGTTQKMLQVFMGSKA
ncbi:MAG: hypothetical protein ACO3UU_08240, partial [Minisyncoccia bacterium]